MKKTLTAEEKPLHKVFHDDFLFTIPSVQRPYSWTEEEAGELLADLMDYIDYHDINANTINNIEDPYFLGSIVLVKKDNNIYEVLDGQQRLTTLTILIAVLRDYLGGNYYDGLNEMLKRKGNFLLNTKDRYRLELRNRDQEFFQAFIQEDHATEQLEEDTKTRTDSQRLIRNNALYFYERLNETDADKVRMLPGVIIQLCYLVVVSTPTFNSAFRIFTVLNDRGLDLMSSDIIKATAIGDISEEEQDHYTRKWEEVEVELGRDRFNKLFDHIRMIIQKRKGGRNIKDEYSLIFEKITGKQFIDDYLLPYSEHYMRIVEYQNFSKENTSVLKLLNMMNKIENADWITVAMYYMEHNGNEVEKFLRRLERFAAVSMILRKNYNWRMSKYSSILREMEHGVDPFSSESSLELSNEDRKAVIQQLNGDVYITLKNSVKRYILLRLDSLLTSGQPFYNFSIITVEHVLPQKIKEGSEWDDLFDQPEEYVHKLGNLVLLTRRKNAKAQNFDFAKKKDSYFQPSSGVTTFPITSQVLQQETWTPVVIEKRQKELIRLLTNEWALDITIPEEEKDKELFYIEAKGLIAQGYPVGVNFKVLKGSVCTKDESNSIQESYVTLRENLLANQILTEGNEGLVFKEDYTFSSPSTAASVVLGRSSNGQTEWKNGKGKTLKEISDS